MTHHAHRLPAPVAFALVALAALLVPSVARAETIACRSTRRR